MELRNALRLPFLLRALWSAGLAAWLLTSGPARAAGGDDPGKGDAPLPRVAVREGRFILQPGGQPFFPHGFQYIRLLPDGRHDVLTPDFYHANAAEAMLADLEGHGFNLVRIFVMLNRPAGPEGLPADYVDNIVDFLRRARRHHIYVIAELMDIPQSSRYEAIKAGTGAEFAGRTAPGPNATRYLSRAYGEAFRLYLRDFAGAIAQRDPGLRSTIFAYELENESALDMTEYPFSATSGTFTAPSGKTYDLAREDELQRLADESAVDWANAGVQAVHAVDPEALVSTSVFTLRAVGRTLPGHQRRDGSATPPSDPRFPLRPLALAGSNLSYLDIHFYPAQTEPPLQTLEADLRAIEWDALAPACRRAGKPLLVGEYGAIKGIVPTFDGALRLMPVGLRWLLAQGFAGYSYWTYDCHEQTPLWHAKDGQGEIFQSLVPLRP